MPAPKSGTKAQANYARMADQWELIRDGLQARHDNQKAHIHSMLKDMPERAAIMQAFERFAETISSLADAVYKADNYRRLHDEQQAKAEAQRDAAMLAEREAAKATDKHAKSPAA